MREKSRVEKGEERGIETKVRTKDYRPEGQGAKEGKVQYVVVQSSGGLNILDWLPTIPGELPTITPIVRTTTVENSLTVERLE